MFDGLLLVCFLVRVSVCQEPQCTSFTFLEQLLEKLVRMEAQLSNLAKKVDDTVRKDDLQTIQPARIAFQSTVSNRHVRLAAGDVLKFDHVITNVGGAYDNCAGMFTAPRDGLYSFHVTVVTDNAADIHGSIAVNGKAAVWYFGHHVDFRSTHDTASQGLLIMLQSGDQVSVKNEGFSGKIMGIHYTSFTGMSL